MAVNTRDRRASVLGLGLASLLILPASGTLDQPDRQQLAYCYRGISAAPATPDPIFMRVVFTGRAASIAFAGRSASVSFTGRSGDMTAVSRSAETTFTGRSGEATFTFIGHE